MSTRTRLVVASAHMLFVELALIRWLGSNVVHLSYFSNIVLLGSFLGIGLGFLRSHSTDRPPVYAPVAVAGLVLFVLLFPIHIDRSGQDVLYFTAFEVSGPPQWMALPLVFAVVALILAGSGELVARPFRALPPLTAYRLDLVGSLIGILGFTALSFLRTPPLGWGVIAAAGYLVLLLPSPGPSRRQRIGVCVSLAVALAALAGETVQPDTSWSPYYKLETAGEGTDRVSLSANGVPHQYMEPAVPRAEREVFYDSPYVRVADHPLDRVLIIGAGTGTDVSLALARGAAHIDAVEIDPGIYELGRDHHPDRPYEDERVDVHIDDGRAFLESATPGYDLILFALPDSLTLVSGASSLRLESYLFTVEAADAARALLAPGGAFGMYNFYRQEWLLDRHAATVAEAFGHPPCVDAYGSIGYAAAVVAAVDADRQRCDAVWTSSTGTRPVRDDRPFLYLRNRGIPSMYLWVLGLMLLVSVLAVHRASGGLRRMVPYRDLFLLGAGFLLLETKGVTTFALLFGTTWIVNAIVFSGVLLAVLLAVEVTRRVPTPPVSGMYGVLAAGLTLTWVVPNEWLLDLSYVPRLFASIGVAFLPIFAANVVFAKRLAEVPDPVTAFGANLLGAMVGGCLEYLALVVGHRGLVVVAAVVYAGAFGALPRAQRNSSGQMPAQTSRPAAPR